MESNPPVKRAVRNGACPSGDVIPVALAGHPWVHLPNTDAAGIVLARRWNADWQLAACGTRLTESMPNRAACAWIAMIAACGAAIVAGAETWKDKRIAEWSPEEARQVLAESPWVKTVTPTPNESGKPGRTRGGAGPDGVGLGGFDLGLPGMGRRGGRSGAGQSPGDDGSQNSGALPTLTLRWISALPISSALLIAREPNAPAVDENHYAIAVYGLPSGFLRGDPDSLGAGLRSRAALKRDKKKDMAPSSVEVLLRDEGPVVVYFFPRSNEITRKDKQVEFDAEIGRLKFAQSFVPDEMVYQGKLEL